MYDPSDPGGPSDKSRMVALMLAFFLGVFGGHRFYAGKVNTALLMLITAGGFGIWWLYDVIVIASGGFRDDEGRLISEWEPSRAQFGHSGLPEGVIAELEALRSEVNELAERVDFTERLLSRPRDPGNDPGRRP